MDSQSPPTISSFVIRFVQEPAEDRSHLHYRGTIRHVQSNQQAGFTSWSEVEAFIERIVPIHESDAGAGIQSITTNPE